MQLVINPLTTKAQVKAFLVRARVRGATHQRFVSVTGQSTLLPITRSVAMTLGNLWAGTLDPVTKVFLALPAEPSLSRVQQTPDDSPLTATQTEALFNLPRGHLTTPSLSFTSFIDALLLTVTAEPDHGFRRSRYSVKEALAAVMQRFPEKNPHSVKQIIKVRPRHLERSKSKDYNDTSARAPRWRYVGPGSGTGLMYRIDELLLKGDLTTRQIGEVVAAEFGRELKGTLALVHARPSQLKRKTGKAIAYRRMLDPTRQTTKREVLKAKNLALLRAQRKAKS